MTERRHRRRALAKGIAVATLVLCVGGATRGESALRLALPEGYGAVDGYVFDEDSERIGRAQLGMSKGVDGRVLVEVETVGNEVTTSMRAELETFEEKLRPVLQEARTLDGEAQPVVSLRIDHRAGHAECEQRENGYARIALPEEDRVANVPLNLLFAPLASGKQEEVAFQFLLCRGSPRILAARGVVLERDASFADYRDLVEVRYELDFGWLSAVARPFVPDMRFWFDPDREHPWVGHRVPLYPQGPTVTIMRNGDSP